ncbi:SUMF1/EgtB/PvdO family nonheme iron enzyme [Roseovarius aestuarii]|uniref:Iron(II)-dependent oxidoreductase EgtB n=1 Tax=Roseovarius aestuarii TaxID=475083 RepID=A0A1X7BQE0_9RHOB|nr:SUMF1/EgtB/PvdO family nonheme iron enzyme [Roseovarius aestuarii]SMC11800.1 Iron(II)-dependent oxidoreductase EgtB [Roseovarius aestuarii]
MLKFLSDVLLRLTDYLFGYDFFLSYAHADFPRYTVKLAESLEKRGFRVFLDKKIYSPGTDLQRATVRRVKMSKYLVVLAGPNALTSSWVIKEVALSIEHGKDPILIDFDGNFSKAAENLEIKRLLSKRLYIAENSANIDQPSEYVLSGLFKGFKSTRQDSIRVRFFSGVSLIFLIIAITAFWQFSIARLNLNNFLAASDVRRLTDLRTEAEALYPAVPENIASFEQWIASAENLLERKKAHSATIAKLRESGTIEAPTSSDLSAGIELEPFVTERDALERRISARKEDTDASSNLIRSLERSLLILDERIKKIELLSEEINWRFPSTENQWMHDTLVALVSDLEEFGNEDPFIGMLANVRERLNFSQKIREASITGTDAEAKWKEAISSISQSQVYGGLKIEPQIGLVPIGKDPKSGLWEFSHLQSGSIATRMQNGNIEIQSEMGLVFILIPGGIGTIGASQSGTANVDPNAHAREGPVHSTKFKPFFISKFEMTQAQWLRSEGSLPSRYSAGQSISDGYVILLTHPVERISWHQASRTMSQLGLRLPTEKEWEYTARAGESSPWWTGQTSLSLQGAANLADLAAKSAGVAWPAILNADVLLNDGFVVHAPVGSFRANPWGLHDVHGNVWEWCQDEYSSYSKEDPTSDTILRVNRGGSFDSPPLTARLAYRFVHNPSDRASYLGVRPARSLE